MKKIRLTEAQILMLQQLESKPKKNKVLKINEDQYNRLFKNKIGKKLDSNLTKYGLDEGKTIKLPEFAQELVVFIKDLINGRHSIPFSDYWSSLGITKGELYKMVNKHGLLNRSIDETEGVVHLSEKHNFRKKIKELYNKITEAGDPGYPAGADMDPNAPWNQDDPEPEDEWEPIRAEKEILKKVYFSEKADNLMIFKRDNMLFVAIGAYMDGEAIEDYEEIRGGWDFENGMYHYVNHNLANGNIHVSSNVEGIEKGEVVQITPEVKEYLIQYYGGDGQLVDILNQIPETTGAASSGAYVGAASMGSPMGVMFGTSPGQEMKRIVGEEEEDIEESTTTTSVGGDSGTFAYDAPAGDGSSFWNAGNKLNKKMKEGMPIVKRQIGEGLSINQIWKNGVGRRKIIGLNKLTGKIKARQWGDGPARDIDLTKNDFGGWSLIEHRKKVLKLTEAQLKKIIESENMNKTAYPNGEMVGFDDCTKLNNNKVAQNGGCSQGAVDNVVKTSKTSGSVVAEEENGENLDLKLYKAKLGEAPIVYVKGNVFDFKDILKKHGAKWNGPGKFWFWFLGKDPERAIQTYVKPAFEEAKQRKGLMIEIDKMIQAIEEEQPSTNPEMQLTKEEEQAIKLKLGSFKKMLTNIEDDEEFKHAMKAIIDIKAAQGYQFSLGNSFLIFIQNRNAGIVNSRTNWLEKYNRNVKSNAKPLMIYAPTGTNFKNKLSKEKKDEVTLNYYKEINKKPGEKLTPREQFGLERVLRGFTFASGFKMVPVYSQHDTVQIEGTEDWVSKSEEARKSMKWFEDNMISDEVRPVYSGLIKYAEDNGIKVELVDDLGGARGVSKGKMVQILQNEGNDVGVTKTLAHEIFHELFHWKSGKFYLGNDMGRDVIEQQAELSAWMFMYSFGFDVKTTSLNYTVMWGGNKNNMLKVFNTVSNAVNKLIDEVNKRIKGVTEEAVGGNVGRHITPQDIAHVLGLEDEYKSALKGQ